MREKINLSYGLTDEQKAVIEKLKGEDCFFLAAIIETSWRDGEPCFIDSHAPISADLRLQFEKQNIKFY